MKSLCLNIRHFLWCQDFRGGRILKRKFAFFVTIAFILIDVLAAFLTQQAIISNMMGILIGIGLIVALILITRLLTKMDLKRGKLVFVAVFFFIVLGRLFMTVA